MGGFIHGGKFGLGFGWVYTRREVLGGFIHGGKFGLGFGRVYTRREVWVRFWVGLYMEGSLS